VEIVEGAEGHLGRQGDPRGRGTDVGDREWILWGGGVERNGDGDVPETGEEPEQSEGLETNSPT